MLLKRRSVFISTLLVLLLMLLVSTTIYADSAPKYVFMLVGDGMANPQINAAEAYKSAKNEGQDEPNNLNFTKFGDVGMSTTYAADRYITGSAAAATAFACGSKTNIGHVGVDVNEKPVKSIAEIAKEAGMKVGIVSSVTIDHATPASYYAHVPDRGMYYEIGLEMAESGFDYIAGGKPRVDKTPEGEATIPEVMEENNYNTIKADENPESFDELESGPAFVYQDGFAGGAFNYALDQEEDELTLANFTEKGIEVLDNNDEGFFMMVEAGKIDWAGHANDAVSNIENTLAFEDSVAKAIEFYEEHPDETLIIVTGDHECGGLTIGWAGTQYESGFDELVKQKRSYEWFDAYVLKEYKNETSQEEAKLADLKDEIERYFGLTDWSERETQQLEKAFERTMMGRKERPDDEMTYLEYGNYEPLTVTLTHLLNQRAGLSWTSYSHTGVPVPVFAEGVGAEKFDGSYDNTDIFHKLLETLRFEEEIVSAVE